MKFTPQLSIEIHLVLFAFIILAGIAFGFLLGRRQIAKMKKNMLYAEEEMLHANNEVLKYAETNKKLTEALEKAKIPVPSISKHSDEDEKVRKIQLGKIG